jgi:capsular exopolysaccharide synthesis family protein
MSSSQITGALEKGRHWRLPPALAEDGEAADSTSVAPDPLLRVEPELVRSSNGDSPTALIDSLLPRVEPEFVRSSNGDSSDSQADDSQAAEHESRNEDSCSVATDTEEPTDLRGEDSASVTVDTLSSSDSSNGNSPSVATEAPAPEEPTAASHGDSVSLTADPVAVAESEGSSNGDSSSATSEALVPDESEVVSNEDCAPAIADRLPPVEQEGSSTGDSPSVATDALPLEAVSTVNSEDSTSVDSHPLFRVEPETSSDVDALPVATESVAPEESTAVTSEHSPAVTVDPLAPMESVDRSNGDAPSVAKHALPASAIERPSEESAPGTSGSSRLSEIQARSSIDQRSLGHVTAPPAELSTAKPFRPSRDGESTNGFRHLTLLAKEESRLVFPTEPNGFAAEQFRLLRRTLYKEFESGAVLLITSPAMGDGKTLTSVNLAACLAEIGQPTLLVEADIRRPGICRVMSGSVEPPGVEDVLARKVEPPRAIHGIKELNLYAAVCAKIPDDPARLIGGPGVKRLLTWARENFLWVVLDAPPVLPAADVPELLPLVDAALLVVRAQNTPRELAKQAIEILGKHLRGVIFNEVTVDSNPHYRYINNYYDPQKSKFKSGRIDFR